MCRQQGLPYDVIPSVMGSIHRQFAPKNTGSTQTRYIIEEPYAQPLFSCSCRLSRGELYISWRQGRGEAPPNIVSSVPQVLRVYPLEKRGKNAKTPGDIRDRKWWKNIPKNFPPEISHASKRECVSLFSRTGARAVG